MNINFEAVIAYFRTLLNPAPREVGSIVADINKQTEELRDRARWERDLQNSNTAEAKRLVEEAAKKEQELNSENEALQESIDRAERVAARFEEMTA